MNARLWDERRAEVEISVGGSRDEHVCVGMSMRGTGIERGRKRE